jgi:hypothetical protein
MKDMKKASLTHNVGDMIERLGEIISRMGATKLGTKVYQTGNKIEHMKDKK